MKKGQGEERELKRVCCQIRKGGSSAVRKHDAARDVLHTEQTH